VLVLVVRAGWIIGGNIRPVDSTELKTDGLLKLRASVVVEPVTSGSAAAANTILESNRTKEAMRGASYTPRRAPATSDEAPASRGKKSTVGVGMAEG